jgi:hypothetical protein
MLIMSCDCNAALTVRLHDGGDRYPVIPIARHSEISYWFDARCTACDARMPAPVVADALGYHQVTTAKLAAQTGGTWSRYAAGDHLRSPSSWTPGRTHDS